jgi:cytochrome oxidase Cu insertion factor (SCO1/SenC/PrrC family)
LITVDPERDTVNQLAEYAPLFHPRLVALTGSPEAIKAAAQAYRVYFAKAGKDGTDDYLMDHSTFIYLMGPEGRYVRHFAHNAAPEEIAAGIEAALAQG